MGFISLKKLLGKKQLWKAIRKILKSLFPELFALVKQSVWAAEEFQKLSGQEKWDEVKRTIELQIPQDELDNWLANLMIELEVGMLKVDGKPRYMRMLDGE